MTLYSGSAFDKHHEKTKNSVQKAIRKLLKSLEKNPKRQSKDLALGFFVGILNRLV